jgi:DNA recombination protein RmuC
MTDAIIGLVIGAILGGGAVWLVMYFRTKGVVQEKVSESESRSRAADGTIIELRTQVTGLLGDLQDTRKELVGESNRRVAAETELDAARRSLEEQRKTLEEAEKNLTTAFEALAAKALQGNREEFAALAKDKVESLVNPLKEALGRYEKQIQGMEQTRAGAYSGLTTHLEVLEKAQKALEMQAGSLAQALKDPTVRGKWGELVLDRVLELSGLPKECITPQASVNTEGGTQIPDVVVTFPGGRCVVIDSKAPDVIYLNAMETEDPEERRMGLRDFAEGVRRHMDTLSGKAYQKQYPTADFVFLFLPHESMFSAALRGDNELIQDGIAEHVILASPTTLVSALHTIAHTWRQQTAVENAERIVDTGRELYERLVVFTRHLAEVANGINKAREAWNNALNSFEGRFEVSARKLKELGNVRADQELPELDRIDGPIKRLSEEGKAEDPPKE